MSRKWIGGAVAALAIAAAAVTATSVLGSDSNAPIQYGKVTVDLSRSAPGHARPVRGGGGSKKPKLVYLQSPSPITINPAPPPAGVGALVDVRLTGCSKVVDGGIVPKDTTDLFIQGSYVKNSKQYHVLIALDDAAAAASPRAPFTITSNLTCLKGVK